MPALPGSHWLPTHAGARAGHHLPPTRDAGETHRGEMTASTDHGFDR